MGTLRLEGLSIRLDPNDIQRGLFVRAAGARRFCFNSAVEAIRDNHAQWRAEEAAVLNNAGVVYLPKIGRVRIASPCPAQARLRRRLRRGRARLTSATISRHADGNWWLSVKIERNLAKEPEHPRPEAAVLGLDRGVSVAAVAATAAGEVIDVLAAGRHRRDIAGMSATEM